MLSLIPVIDSMESHTKCTGTHTICMGVIDIDFQPTVQSTVYICHVYIPYPPNVQYIYCVCMAILYICHGCGYGVTVCAHQHIVPRRYWLLTPELQKKSRGKRVLQGGVCADLQERLGGEGGGDPCDHRAPTRHRHLCVCVPWAPLSDAPYIYTGRPRDIQGRPGTLFRGEQPVSKGYCLWTALPVRHAIRVQCETLQGGVNSRHRRASHAHGVCMIMVHTL
jgi:hypothetical protein